MTPADLGPGWTVEPSDEAPDDDSADTGSADTGSDGGDDGPEAGSPMDQAWNQQCKPYRDDPGITHQVDVSTDLVAPDDEHSPDADADLTVEISQNPADKVQREVDTQKATIAQCHSVVVHTETGDTRLLTDPASVAPLGDETIASTMTIDDSGQSSTLKEILVRVGDTLIDISGTSQAVDRHAAQAVAKARSVVG